MFAIDKDLPSCCSITDCANFSITIAREFIYKKKTIKFLYFFSKKCKFRQFLY